MASIDPPPMVLTRDDRRILVELYRYRYLQTDQIYELFPERSRQGLRRRLRLMSGHGFLMNPQRSVRVTPTAHNAYGLTKKGMVIVAEEFDSPLETIQSPYKSARVGAAYLAHYILSNQIRIVVEKALEDHPHLALKKYVHEYELKDAGAPASSRRERYLLKRQLRSSSGKRFAWEPDGAFLAHPRGKESATVLFCVEADRGTMSHTRIKDKLIGYSLFIKENGYKDFGAKAIRVLFVLENKGRVPNMVKTFSKNPNSDVFLAVHVDDISEKSFFDAPIWSAAGSDEKKQRLYTAQG